MPSFCTTTLFISGPKQEIKNFALELNENKERFFEWLMPLQQRHYEDTDSIADYWGSKWEAHDLEFHIYGHNVDTTNPTGVRSTKSLIRMSFRNPWSPPKGIIDKLFFKYPQFKFEIAWDLEGEYDVDLP